MDANTHKDLNRRSDELELVFDERVNAGVPTYAPLHFAEAKRLLVEIRESGGRKDASAETPEQEARAVAALNDATTHAERVRPILQPLVAARSRAIHDSLAMYHGIKQFSEGERLFHQAVELGESGDTSAAQEAATAAEQSYREAALVSLEKGPIQRLVSDAASAAEVASLNVQRIVQEEIDDLNRATEATRRGDMTLSTLRAKINSGTGVSRALLGQFDRTGGPFVATDPPFSDPGYAPGTFEPPPAPVTMRISDRTSTSVEVVWNNLGGVVDAITLERSISDGPWQAIREFPPASGWQTWVDIGLTPDTLHRYRVRVRNSVGSRFTPWGKQAVAYTKTAQTFAVWRAQLTLRIVDAGDAGTGDDIQILLNSPLATHAPSSNRTWLDHAPRPIGPISIDDFARGTEWTYDLNLNALGQLGDITMISIKKEGTDAVRIAGFSLLVNNIAVFTKTFGDTPDTWLSLDESSEDSPTFAVYHPELRAHAQWQDYMQSPPQFPSTIPGDEMKGRLEGIVGHTLKGTPAYWRSTNNPVKLTRLDAQTLRVTVALAADISLLPDPDVDLSFDLGFVIVCNEAVTVATLTLATSNVSSNADYNVLVDILSVAGAPAGVALVQFIEHLVDQQFRASWQAIVQNFAIDPPFPGVCPRVLVRSIASGEISVEFRAF